MNILILMAGSDKDFCEKGYPKYLIEIKNKPIIQRTIELLKTVGNNITCIIRKEDQDKYFLGDTLKILCPKCKIIEIAVCFLSFLLGTLILATTILASWI